MLKTECTAIMEIHQVNAIFKVFTEKAGEI